MALSTQADVEAALGRLLADGEDIDWMLERASDRVAAFLGGRPDPVPPEVSGVVAEVVKAQLTSPAKTAADYNAGGYYQQREVATIQIRPDSVTNSGPWLSKEQKATLRPFRMKKAQSAYSIDLIENTDGE